MRLRNRKFVLAFLAVCCLVELTWGATNSSPTLLPVDDPAIYRDLQNISQNLQNPVIQSATISSATIGSATISTLTTSSATISNATIGNLIITGTASGVTTLGKIRQIKQCTSGTTATTTSTSYSDTSLTCAITPTLIGSSITIVAMGNLVQDNSGQSTYSTIFRDSQNLAGGTDVLGDASAGSSGIVIPATLSILDSPNTTSSITYKVDIRVTGGTGHWGMGGYLQTMILTEYAP